MILTIIEHDNGEVKDVSYEALTAAAQLANSMGLPSEAVIVGDGVDGLAPKAFEYGASKAYVINDARFASYSTEAIGKAIAQLIESKGALGVTAPGTDRGNELMAHIAANLNQPMAANCTEVASEGDALKVVRQRWGGSLLEDALLHGAPKLFTTAPHSVTAAPSAGSGTDVESFSPTLEERDFRVQVARKEASENQGVSLADAKVVIGGGRGVGSAEDFAILEELAGLMNAAVGGSRVATNNGWRPHSDQIGQTGQQIAPDLYIACGISGAIQHVVGCKGSKNILAINTDADAPIFSRADYGVIGDLHEVIPALIEELKKG